MIDTWQRAKLRNATKFFYDLQKLRIQSGNRATKQAEHAQAALDKSDKDFLGSTSDGLKELEKQGLKEIKRLLKGIPVWELWLKDEVRGVGPAMAAVMISELDIERATYPSKFWAVAGLAVDTTTGKAVRRKRGEKSNWNPFLKSKLIEVLGKCLIKSGAPLDNMTSTGKERKPRPASEWYTIYTDRKHRRKTQLLPTCMACDGTGKSKFKPKPAQVSESDKKSESKEPSKPTEPVGCTNCGSSGGPAPWGCSDAHREIDARRYMVKQFLVAFWTKWRKLEDLPTRPTYAEEKLGIVHSGGSWEARL